MITSQRFTVTVKNDSSVASLFKYSLLKFQKGPAFPLSISVDYSEPSTLTLFKSQSFYRSRATCKRCHGNLAQSLTRRGVCTSD